jgi:hypothetical protein
VYTTIAIALKRLMLRAFCPLRLAQHRPDPVEPSFSVWFSCFKPPARKTLTSMKPI